MGLINKILKNKANSKEEDVKVAKTKKEKATKTTSAKQDKKSEEKKSSKIAKLSNLKLDTSSISDKVLCGPLVTEKAAIAESLNKYSFKVATWANKIQIKKAVLEIYGVMPVKVTTTNVDGKKVSFRRKSGRRQDFKKAVVTLPKGKTIDIHKGV